LTRWRSDALSFERAFDRQALPMIWDFGELNPLADVRGCWDIDFISACITHFAAAAAVPATVVQGTATSLPWPDSSFDAVLTDPPYYDNVPYSDLSDFFYVWLKRSVGNLYPELFATPLTPKSEEIVWHQRHGGSYEAGKKFFEQEILRAFREIRRILKPDGIAVVVFAHKTTEAWEVILNAFLTAGIYMTGSWPIYTEMETKVNAQGTASLMSSIYMVCRKRTSKDIGEFPKVKLDIENRVRQKLEKFWNEGIRGADFFMSAIGPAVEVFGRYERVEKLSGETVTVAELLDYVETVVSEFALERILGSAELSGIDPETRFYLLWRWTYNSSRVAFDEAHKLAAAVGTELTALWGDGGFVRKEKEFVRALGPVEREKDTKFMHQVGFNTMVDAIHRGCIYWEQGEQRQLKDHLAQTFGSNNAFWRVAQNIADVLPDGDKEKQLLQGLLNTPEARGKATASTGKLFG
jgi:putative DNA methylase